MNTLWSDHIQGVMTLYLSRKLRFDDRFAGRYLSLFGLDRRRALSLLEIGCGPGALAGALARWYPRARITGIDRDSRFIAFAKEHEPRVRFAEGDAAALPFADGSFDVTISYTVQEHVEPAAFWGEQFRVLKPGGVCLCLSVRKGVRAAAPCLAMTEPEKRFWDAQDDEGPAQYGAGRYALSEAALPAVMEAYGFAKVTAGWTAVDLTPDDPAVPAALAEAMIEAERQNDLEAVRSAHSAEEGPAIATIDAKYDERLRLYRAGEKQWDTAVTLTMVLRGVKP